MNEVVRQAPLVRAHEVSKHFGEGQTRVDALRDVSLEVYPGQVVALLGPSGSGKTTLLNVIGCILEPNSGRVELDGEVVYDGRWLRSDLRRLRLEKVGFIFQFHNLLPFLNSTENVAVVLSLAGYQPAEAKKRAVELLDYLEVGHRKTAMPANLSGGEAQRVAIARALANRPRIILADEPIASLDPASARLIMSTLREINRQDKTTVIVSLHQIDHAFEHCDRIIALKDGRVIHNGPTSGITPADIADLYGVEDGSLDLVKGRPAQGATGGGPRNAPARPAAAPRPGNGLDHEEDLAARVAATA